MCGDKNENLSMTYDANPSHNYDNTVRGKRRMFVVQRGQKRPLSKKAYVDMMNRFGKIHGFAVLHHKMIVHRDS